MLIRIKKTYRAFIWLSILALCFNAAYADEPELRGPKDETISTKFDTTNPSLKTMMVRITGSMCPVCLRQLQIKLKQMAGVGEVALNPGIEKNLPVKLQDEMHPRKHQAIFELQFNPKVTNANEILKAIKQSDFAIVKTRFITQLRESAN